MTWLRAGATEGSWLDSQHEQDCGSSQPRIRWLPEDLSPRLKRLEPEAIYSFPSSAVVK